MLSHIISSPFLARGFRPFFLLGAIYSVISLWIWAGYYAGSYGLPELPMDPVLWHAHEMIYGFAMAIVAGFLLTAVANWTGGAPARQVHLLLLCLLWGLGRFVLNVDMDLPFWMICVAELSFIPALTLSLAIPLFRSWNKRNFVFLTLLFVMFCCDVAVMIAEYRPALYVALLVVLVMVSLIGGRIIPAFTVAALRRKGIEAYQVPQMMMDVCALASLILVMVCLYLGISSWFLSFCATLSCIIHAVRMRHYHTIKALSDPMLWILHIGYLWLVAGLALLVLSSLSVIAFSVALHAFTVGCIGSMTLGMMCRVTLGHTGRELHANRMTIVAFALMQLAALLRVLGPILMTEYMTVWIVASAVLWSVCFAIFILVYGTALWQPRPDGREA